MTMVSVLWCHKVCQIFRLQKDFEKNIFSIIAKVLVIVVLLIVILTQSDNGIIVE